MRTTTHQAACPARGCTRVVASPRARRAMRQRGIDPASIRGTGPGGRIVEADVLRAAGSALPTPSGLPPGMVGRHFHVRAVVDLTSLVQVQRQIAEDIQRMCGQPLRLADLLLRAMGLALADCPQANRIWQGEMLAAPETADVAFEVETSGARYAPAVCRADRLHLVDLVRRRAELTVAARAGSLPREAARGAAICLCDLTEQPIDEYAAVLRSPHTSALAAGRAAPRPFVVEGRLSVRQTVHLTLSADPRALSPQTAAALLGCIVDLLQRPLVLFLERPRP